MRRAPGRKGLRAPIVGVWVGALGAAAGARGAGPKSFRGPARAAITARLRGARLRRSPRRPAAGPGFVESRPPGAAVPSRVPGRRVVNTLWKRDPRRVFRASPGSVRGRAPGGGGARGRGGGTGGFLPKFDSTFLCFVASFFGLVCGSDVCRRF